MLVAALGEISPAGGGRQVTFIHLPSILILAESL